MKGLLIAIAVLSASACSPANVAGPAAPSGDAGDSGGSAARACSDSAFARCSQLQGCSTTAVQLRFGDLHTCQAIYQSTCLNNIQAPSSGTTAATVEACAQGISKWSCRDYLDTQNPPPACQPQVGHVATGAPCGVSQQCQSGFCSIAPGRMCGTCRPPPQPGNSCAALVSCGPSLFCTNTTLECQGFVQMGGACSRGLPCAAGLTCVGYNAQTNAPGTCQAAVTTTGSACSFLGAGCDPFAGLSCNAETQLCETAKIVGTGEACGLVANQQAYCANAGQCVAGSCQAAAGVGEACDLVDGPACITLTRCIVDADGGTSGTCRVPSGSTCR